VFNILYKKYLVVLNMDEIDIKELVEKVKRQTSLTEDIIREQLQKTNYNYIEVIKNHFNVPKKEVKQIVSLNQEIYKQLREKMDNIMKDYNKKQQDKEV
jgi:hypothetical protein